MKRASRGNTHVLILKKEDGNVPAFATLRLPSLPCGETGADDEETVHYTTFGLVDDKSVGGGGALLFLVAKRSTIIN